MKKKTAYCIIIITLALFSSCEKQEYEEVKEDVKFAFAATDTESDNEGNSRGNSTEQNLLVNGGLEEWSTFITPEMPKGWSLPHNLFVKQNRTIVCEGCSSAKMQSNEKGETARLEQKIMVIPHEMLKIRFRYYIEKWKSKGARTYCYFRTDAAEKYNISADELESFYGKDTYYIIRGGGYGLTYFPHELNVWQTFDETIEVPPTANYFVFGINSYYGTTIYVDDCWVIDVTDQTSTDIRPVTM
jgi:hypothetical protein